MKIRVVSRGELAFVVPDGVPTSLDTHGMPGGTEKTVEVQRSLTICGNPSDPWRVVIDLTFVDDERPLANPIGRLPEGS